MDLVSIENFVSEGMNLHINLHGPDFINISLGVWQKFSDKTSLALIGPTFPFHFFINVSGHQSIWCQGIHSLQPERLFLASLCSICSHIHHLKTVLEISCPGWIHRWYI